MKTPQKSKSKAHIPSPSPLTIQEVTSSPEFSKYNESRLGVFLIQALTGNDDLTHIAAESLVGGDNDKKVDVLFISLETRTAYIGQLYIARKWANTSAPANKASDLNTATAWILSTTQLNKVPQTLADRARELQRLLKSGEIKQIHLFYCHNCKESKNVRDELEAAAESFEKRLKSDEIVGVQVTAVEYGIQRLQTLVESDPDSLYVDERIEFNKDETISRSTADWEAIVATVDGSWLQDLYQKHQATLFSANFRDFLGASKRRRDINGGIKNTIQKEPENFWAYNNGITVLCQKIVSRKTRVTISGLAIVNGAQTTGSFGESTDAKNAGVLARFIRCDKRSLINDIVRFNNTQNEIKPADTRAKDHVQARLKKEFKEFGIEYQMRRSRGKAPDNSVASTVIAVALAAYHGHAQLAARNSADIFLDDETYGLVFRSDLTARHAAAVLSLSNAIDNLKRYLKAKIDDETARGSEVDTYDALRYSMSKHFVMDVIGRLSEEIVGIKLSSPYQPELKSIAGNTVSSLEKAWYEVLRGLIPLIGREIKKLGDAYDVTRDISKVPLVASECMALVGIMRDGNPKPLLTLKNKLI